jgi:hypothetical protein
MDLSRDLEVVGNEILALMGKADFASKLSSITLEKSDDSTLANFTCRKYGWANNEAELPALYVMGLREELISDEGDYRWMWFKYAIEVYDSGADAQELEKRLNRYARALQETLLSEYKKDALITVVEYAPVLKNEDSLFKACSIQFQIKVFQDTR